MPLVFIVSIARAGCVVIRLYLKEDWLIFSIAVHRIMIFRLDYCLFSFALSLSSLSILIDIRQLRSIECHLGVQSRRTTLQRNSRSDSRLSRRRNFCDTYWFLQVRGKLLQYSDLALSATLLEPSQRRLPHIVSRLRFRIMYRRRFTNLPMVHGQSVLLISCVRRRRLTVRIS